MLITNKGCSEVDSLPGDRGGRNRSNTSDHFTTVRGGGDHTIFLRPFCFQHSTRKGTKTMTLRNIRQSWRHYWRLSRIAKWEPMGCHSTMATRAVNAYTHREHKKYYRQLDGPKGALP
jgi:hypothetical protein